MGERKHFSSKEFTSKKEVQILNDEHKKVFGSDINKQGYPDMGNGLYSKHLSYDQWVNFNNAQRGHYNMVESSGPVVACLVISGLQSPRISAILGFCYGFGRFLYSLGYTSGGANGRIAGAVISILGQFGLWGLTAYNGMAMTGIAKAIMEKY
jgi:hypothetical protein